MAKHTLTIDSQVPTYKRNRKEQNWNRHLERPKEVTGRDMVTAMTAAGVNGAFLISPFVLYGYDATSYILEVYRNYPSRFGLIQHVDSHVESITNDIAFGENAPKVAGARLFQYTCRMTVQY